MFDYFSDYIALIICLLKHVQYPKRMLAKLLREYEECINELYISLTLPIYNKVVATGIQGKIKKLNAYVKKQLQVLAYFVVMVYIISKD